MGFLPHVLILLSLSLSLSLSLYLYLSLSHLSPSLSLSLSFSFYLSRPNYGVAEASRGRHGAEVDRVDVNIRLA